MTTKTCPGCSVKEDEDPPECRGCGYDFSPLLGTAEQARTLLRERLERARTAWRQPRAAPDRVSALSRDAFETPEEHAARLRFQSRLRAVQFSATSAGNQIHPRRGLGALLVGLGVMASLVLALLLFPFSNHEDESKPGDWSNTKNDQTATAPPEPEFFAGRYRNLGDGTVMGVRTELQWMRCSLVQNWQGKLPYCLGDAEKLTFNDAERAVTALNEAGSQPGY